MSAEFKVSTWEECEEKVKEIKSGTTSRAAECWFRGHACADWALETTLERRSKTEWLFSDYYNLVSRIWPQIATFTDSKWRLPTQSRLLKWVADYDAHRTGAQKMLAPEYLSHLRHNGFPSPLMDWTSSLYIAAYFAFENINGGSEVAIYVYCEYPDGIKGSSSGDPQIRTLGPYMKTHRRHYLQKSRYTVCAQFKKGKYGRREWHFASHQSLVAENSCEKSSFRRFTNQDSVWKITIPATERTKVMVLLDQYNINAFSLFDDEEHLLKMLAAKEIDKKK